MENLDGLKVCIEEMNRNLKLEYEGVDMLKTTARSVLSAASLITALISALQLARPAIQSGYSVLYNAGIICALVLYVALIMACVKAITAINWSAPVDADWKVLYNAFANKTGEKLLTMQMSSMLNAYLDV